MTGTTMSPKQNRRDLNGSPLMYQSDAVQVKPSVLESKVMGKKGSEVFFIHCKTCVYFNT